MTVTFRDDMQKQKLLSSGLSRASWNAPLAIFLASLLDLCASRHTLAGPSFQPLEFLPGGSEGKALDVTDSGRFIVGYVETPDGRYAVRWGPTGPLNLGDLLGGAVYAVATCVSNDGKRIGGFSKSTLSAQSRPDDDEAFLWAQGQGMQGLGDFSGGAFNSQVRAMSANSNVLVGFCTSDLDREATRRADGQWIGGMDPGPTPFLSIANGVSGNGTVLVGRHKVPGGVLSFRWTATQGWLDLEELPGGIMYAGGYAVSTDGAVVVGEATSDLGGEAVRWKQVNGQWRIERLGGIGGNVSRSYANSANQDGSIIVGALVENNEDQAFIWTTICGLQKLQILLESQFDLSVPLQGWHLQQATSISRDGRFVVGWGKNPSEEVQGWIVDLRRE